MRVLITIGLVLMTTLFSFAQINGNGQVITKTFELQKIFVLEVQMYAKIKVDMDASPGITITAESNLFDFINRNVHKGRLILDQKKWIEPTREINITIGAPGLREIEMGSHDVVRAINVKGDLFKVDAPIGTVILEGKVNEIRVKTKKGKVDASNLMSNTASIRIKKDGEVIVNSISIVDCAIDDDGRVTNVNPNAVLNECQKGIVNSQKEVIDTRFIDIKIKNNSLGRKHFVVVGPKPNGRKFSYGFALLPYQSKKERWTIGTKVYRENSIGQRELLVELTEYDEGETVNLFEWKPKRHGDL
ncbi:MAG: DUF2807 domain-containing protein [Saprospiraceae bacterium]|nr:DUF2807 domain-containing protein [Saprospiraceae bacterium]